MPSASVMMREMRMPVLVESKYRIGRRMTCASTSLRISVIARWAATPRTCEFRKAVAAPTSVAAPVARARRGSSSQWPLLMTSSIRYLVVVGRTRSDRRLMTISVRPRARRLRCAQMRARASSQAPAVSFFFGLEGSATCGSYPGGSGGAHPANGWANNRPGSGV